MVIYGECNQLPLVVKHPLRAVLSSGWLAQWSSVCAATLLQVAKMGKSSKSGSEKSTWKQSDEFQTRFPM